MRAILLAAGFGTRLRPLTNSVPKCLVPIGGRPLIDFWLDLLLEAGIERILVNTHYFSDQVVSHLTCSPWASHIDLVYEPELLGTGGTVLANRNFFKDEAFLVAHADNLTNFDLIAFLDHHKNRPVGVEISMLAFHTDNPRQCGILELSADDCVVAFHEKVEDPPGNLANGAVYIFEPAVLNVIKELGKPVVDLSTEIIPTFIGRILAVKHTGYHRDIGSLDSLQQAERDLATGVFSAHHNVCPPLNVLPLKLATDA